MNSSTEKGTETSEKHSGFQQDLEYVHQVPLFQNLEYECLKLIAMLSKQINLLDGDRLITQGEDDGNGYYVISGRLKGYHQKNNLDYPIQTFAEGQFIGGLSLLGKSIRLYTVHAVEESKVLRLNREGFQKIMKQHPESLARVAANLTTELTIQDQKILNSTTAENMEQAAQGLGISLL